MAKKATAPSSSARRAPGQSRPRRGAQSTTQGASRRVDVRGWLGGIRLSGFMFVMMGLVVLAAFVLVPTFGNYVQQRQRIAALEAGVLVSMQELEDLKAQQERWSDPAYITTQARERLYYVRPGEVVYLIVNDLDAALQPTDEAPVSADITETRTDWMTQMMLSVTSAGVADTVREPTIGVPDPAPSGTPAG